MNLDTIKSARRQQTSQDVDIVKTTRRFEKLRWIVREESSDSLVRNDAPGIILHPIPHAEGKQATCGQDTAHFTEGAVFIRHEYESKLTDGHVERSVGERQIRDVRLLPSNSLRGVQFLLRVVEHAGR